MGGGPSLPSFPVIFQAKARYQDPSELKQIIVGFRELTSTTVSKEQFCSLFHEEGESYARLLYYTLKNGHKGNEPLSLEEFIKGHAMLVKGSPEEVVTFYFRIFDPSHSNEITTEQFHKRLSAICDAAFSSSLPLFYYPGTSNLPPTKELHKEKVDKVSKRGMNGQEKLSFEHFSQWIRSFPQIGAFISYSLQKIVAKKTELPPVLQSLLVQPPLMIQNDKSLLTDEQAVILRSWLPEPHCKCHFFNLFSTKSQGFALGTLYRNFENKNEALMKNPSILIIKDSNGHIFGGFSAEGWFKHAERFYGSEESFLFSLFPNVEVYRCTGEDKNIMYSTTEFLAMGGKFHYFGFSIDEELEHGKAHPCVTFGAPRLSKEEDFQISAVQMWGLIDSEGTRFLFNVDSDDELDIELLREKEVAGPSIWDMEESWVLDEIKGVGYSKNLAPPPEWSDGEEETEERKRVKKLIMPL